MSYSLGQAKVLPGQINFMTTRSGRIPSLQPLLQAGLPYAPYIEHGSWTTGQPDIARYGRDPYRGLGVYPGRGPCGTAWENGRRLPGCIIPYGMGQELPGNVAERADAAVAQITEAGTQAARDLTQGAILVGLGAFVGGAAGAAGGSLKKPVLGALIGAVGGGVLGYLAKSKLATATASTTPSAPSLQGVLAVL